jgi:ribonuclease HI
MMKADYTIVFDGGCIGNPGRGYGSYAITDSSGQRTITRLDFPGRTTNNETEYDTLITALRHLAEAVQAQGRPPGDVTVEVRGDSLLVINQVTGRWKAHEPRMAERRDGVRQAASVFKRVSFAQQPRARSVAVLGH